MTRTLVSVVGFLIGICLVSVASATPAAASSVDVEADVIEAPVEPPIPCAPDATGAVVAVREIFSGLASLYRDRLPGPAGEAYLEQRSEKLIHTLADAEAFSEAILRGLQPELNPNQGPAWIEMFGTLLRQRIRRRIQDPRGHTLAIQEASVSCHRARVQLSLRGNNSERRNAKVTLRLVLRRHGWRVYDMAVQGIGLVHTWRNRLHRIRREQGLDGMERQLALMQRRLGVKGPAEGIPAD